MQSFSEPFSRTKIALGTVLLIVLIRLYENNTLTGTETKLEPHKTTNIQDVVSTEAASIQVRM